MEKSRKINITTLLKDTCNLFIKNIYLFLLLASIVGGLTYKYCESNYTPMYSSTVTFIVRPSMTVTADNLGSSYAVIKQISKSFPYIISNDIMKDYVKKETGEEITLDNIKIESLADTNSFTVSVMHEDQQKSYDILSTIIKNYSSIGEKIIGDTYISIISEISTSEDPVNQNTSRKIALIAMLVVFAVMVLIFGFYSYSKKTIRNKKDLKKSLNLSCLVSIPKVSKGYVLITNKKTPYLIKEQIKKLRIKIEGWKRELDVNSFLVTSSLADEGKSTVSLNLALSLVEKGYKTIIIDFDFRNPSILKMLGYPVEKEDAIGLYDLISGQETSLKDIIFEDLYTGLHVITSGDLRGHSVKSLLNYEDIKNILSTVKSQYDFVIIDTPPSSILSDSSDVSHLVDFGIYVVRCDYAPLSVIEEGLDLLSDTGLTFMGCVLNYSTDKGAVNYKYYRKKGNINE